MSTAPWSTEKLVIQDAKSLLMAEGCIHICARARGCGIPRCRRTQARTYARYRDLEGTSDPTSNTAT